MGKKTIEKNAITEGVIWKQLLIFFFPIMLGTLIQQLYTCLLYTSMRKNCDGKGFNGTDSQAGQGLGGKSDSL